MEKINIEQTKAFYEKIDRDNKEIQEFLDSCEELPKALSKEEEEFIINPKHSYWTVDENEDLHKNLEQVTSHPFIEASIIKNGKLVKLSEEECRINKK